ncbi:MAG: discoidin domain-containing protein [Verrucomicrobia bacterium]|nr:discoidin domain-containing protein [Verrucomicrobiota bacterium]
MRGLASRPWVPMMVVACFASLPRPATAESGPPDDGISHGIAMRLSGRLPAVEARLAEIAEETARLPVMPDMDSLGSHGYHSDFTMDSESNWFRIDWPEPRRIDGIALIPTRLTTQSGEMSNYGLPNRLRIEAGRPGKDAPEVIAELSDTCLEMRRGEPVFLSVGPLEVRWLRVIPIDLPPLPGKSVRFFSVSEFLVFDGPRNIAPEGGLSAGYSIDAEVGWNIRYLVDGQSPLGPPEKPPHPKCLGWHADIAATGDTVTWAAVDLGVARTVDRVRIVAAKGDSPVKGPGFGFPAGFRIETSPDAAGDQWTEVWNSGADLYQNPGYNPVDLSFPPHTARRVRLFIDKQHQPDHLTAPRVLLSEFEIYHDGELLSLDKPVATSDRVKSRPHDATRIWSGDGLTDGCTSTGTLIPQRQWVEELATRFRLSVERSALLKERARVLTATRAWTLATAFTVLGITIIGLTVWMIRLRLAARRHIRNLRRRISSDLHDEVGSNLATISLLAEIGPSDAGRAPLGDIGRLAREASLSLHEIVDLTLVPKRARKPLPERLREIAGLMLKDHRWQLEGEASPELDPEQRRNLIFYFKEALHNILRHAKAAEVSIRLAADGRDVLLTISDDGVGLPPAPPAGGPRLRTLEQRAESLHGGLEIHTGPGRGTTLILRFPLKTDSKRRKMAL